MLGFVNAPLFATFLLGMFWKRATGHGAFWGYLGGLITAGLTLALTYAEGKGGWLGHVHEFSSAMAQSFWVALLGWTACLGLTFLVSLLTKPKSTADLQNLVYGHMDVPNDVGTPWYKRPGPLAIIVLCMLVVLNLIFW